MSREQREYSGWLPVQLTPDKRSAVLRAAEEVGLEVDVSETYLEFEYSGPDTNRVVISLLKKLAPMLGTVDGEIRCEVYREDSGESSFEFYQFRDGRLVRQNARLVRDAPEIVDGA